MGNRMANMQSSVYLHANSGRTGAPPARSHVALVDRAAKLALLSLVAMMSVAGFAPAASAANPKTFATGSLIIPMDTTSQNFGMFKAYGLVYKLLQSGVPVYWLIADGKTFNGIDFSVSTKNHLHAAPPSAPPTTIRAGRSSSTARTSRSPIRSSRPGATPTAPTRRSPSTRPPRRSTSPTSRWSCRARRGSRSSDQRRHRHRVLQRGGHPRRQRQCLDRAVAERPERGQHRGLPQRGRARRRPSATARCSRAAPAAARKYDVFVTPHNSGYAYSPTDPTESRNADVRGARLLRRPGRRLDRAVPLDPEQRERHRRPVPERSNAAVRALFKSPTDGGFLTQNRLHDHFQRGGNLDRRPGRAELPIAQAVPTTGRERIARRLGAELAQPLRPPAAHGCADVLARRPSGSPRSSRRPASSTTGPSTARTTTAKGRGR